MTEFCIELLFTRLNLDEESILAALAKANVITAEPFENATTRITAAIEAPNAIRGAATLITELRHSLPDAKPVTTFRNLVNITDIAEQAGVTREAVRHWATGARRSGQFPEAVGCVGSQKIWEWTSIHLWLRANLDIWDGLTFPTHAELGAIDAHIATCNATPNSTVRPVARCWSLVSTTDIETLVPADHRILPNPRTQNWKRAAAA